MPSEAEEKAAYRSGYVALVGRPNAGKSTLLNRLVGEKIAAVSNKPQTTRHKIQGIITRDDGQIVLVDTPGVHRPGFLLNRRMMAAVHDALASVDLVCVLRDASVATGNGDRFVLELIKQSGQPAILVLNKSDKIADKHKLLPLMQWYGGEYDWREIVPISALKGDMVDRMLPAMVRNLPEGAPIFEADELTDQSLRQMVAEIVREKVLRITGDEIPYVTAVATEQFDEANPGLTRIACAIVVERSSQKGIIIGKGGAKLKEIGSSARTDIEKLLGHQCHLELFVKVEEHWRDREHLLDDLGIRE